MALFSEELDLKIKHFLQRYETKRSAILPILHAIQDENGWIQKEHIEALDSNYGLEKVHVQEVLTFYTMYRQEKPAKYSILFCDNIVCSMLGAKKVMHKIEGMIKTLEENGQKNLFSLHGVPCLGVCDGAPAMLINKDRHLKVTSDQVEGILKKYTSTSSSL